MPFVKLWIIGKIFLSYINRDVLEAKRLGYLSIRSVTVGRCCILGGLILAGVKKEEMHHKHTPTDAHPRCCIFN